jgi:hypothetical protein
MQNATKTMRVFGCRRGWGAIHINSLLRRASDANERSVRSTNGGADGQANENDLQQQQSCNCRCDRRSPDGSLCSGRKGHCRPLFRFATGKLGCKPRPVKTDGSGSSQCGVASQGDSFSRAKAPAALSCRRSGRTAACFERERPQKTAESRSIYSISRFICSPPFPSTHWEIGTPRPTANARRTAEDRLNLAVNTRRCPDAEATKWRFCSPRRATFAAVSHSQELADQAKQSGENAVRLWREALATNGASLPVICCLC